MIGRSIDIREVGPRDGLQLEAPLSFEDKARLLTSLASTGVKRIEATAFVSPRAVPAMADADRVGDLVRQWPEITWSALVPNPRGASRALASGFTNLEYVVSVSDSHSLANVGRTTDEALAGVEEVGDMVHTAGGTLEVILATAWDCPFEGEMDAFKAVAIAARAIDLGADEICIADTIGTVVPHRVLGLFGIARQAIPDVAIGAHFHNTRGSGIACAFAAIEAGVTKLDSSVGGLGGCPFAPGATGNIATEELVYLLEGSDWQTGVNLDAALDSARLVEELVGHPVESNLLRAGGRSNPHVAGNQESLPRKGSQS